MQSVTCVVSGEKFAGLQPDAFKKMTVTKGERGYKFQNSGSVVVSQHMGDIRLKDAKVLVLSSDLGFAGKLNVNDTGPYACRAAKDAANVIKFLSIPFGSEYSDTQSERLSLLFARAVCDASGYSTLNNMSPEDFDKFCVSMAASMLNISKFVLAGVQASADEMELNAIGNVLVPSLTSHET